MRVTVFVKLKAKQEKIEKISDTELQVWLREQPVEGKANKELIKLLAKHLRVPQKNIEIISGKTSKHKILEIIM